MPLHPLVISTLGAAAAMGWALHLAVDPAPFASDAAAVLAVTMTVGAVVVGAAVLVAGARWARWGLAALSAACLALGAATPLDPGGIAAIVLGGAALAGALGPWLPGWLRRLPAAEAPPAAAGAAVAALGLLPAAVAVIRHSGLGGLDWALCGSAAAVAWGLSRAMGGALWAARLVIPSLAVATAVTDGFPAGLYLGIAGVAAGLAAWLPGVALAVIPVSSAGRAVPFPPELVAPALLEAAGYDDRGRPRREA